MERISNLDRVPPPPGNSVGVSLGTPVGVSLGTPVEVAEGMAVAVSVGTSVGVSSRIIKLLILCTLHNIGESCEFLDPLVSGSCFDEQGTHR